MRPASGSAAASAQDSRPGLRVDVLLRDRNQLGVGPVVRTTEDAELVERGDIAITPAERWEDDDLLTGIAPDACTVRAEDQRDGKAVDPFPHECVATVDSRSAKLDNDLARPRLRIGHNFGAQHFRPAVLAYDDRLH